MGEQADVATVSCGAFRCRLEGFEEPMAALAELAPWLAAAWADPRALHRGAPSWVRREMRNGALVLRPRAPAEGAARPAPDGPSGSLGGDPGAVVREVAAPPAPDTRPAPPETGSAPDRRARGPEADPARAGGEGVGPPATADDILARVTRAAAERAGGRGSTTAPVVDSGTPAGGPDPSADPGSVAPGEPGPRPPIPRDRGGRDVGEVVALDVPPAGAERIADDREAPSTAPERERASGSHLGHPVAGARSAGRPGATATARPRPLDPTVPRGDGRGIEPDGRGRGGRRPPGPATRRPRRRPPPAVDDAHGPGPPPPPGRPSRSVRVKAEPNHPSNKAPRASPPGVPSPGLRGAVRAPGQASVASLAPRRGRAGCASAGRPAGASTPSSCGNGRPPPGSVEAAPSARAPGGSSAGGSRRGGAGDGAGRAGDGRPRRRAGPGRTPPRRRRCECRGEGRRAASCRGRPRGASRSPEPACCGRGRHRSSARRWARSRHPSAARRSRPGRSARPPPGPGRASMRPRAVAIGAPSVRAAMAMATASAFRARAFARPRARTRAGRPHEPHRPRRRRRAARTGRRAPPSACGWRGPSSTPWAGSHPAHAPSRPAGSLWRRSTTGPSRRPRRAGRAWCRGAASASSP